MATVLEKVKQLEQYIAYNNAAIDPVVDMTIDKLLSRENKRILTQKIQLAEQLTYFEQQYKLQSDEFYRRYQSGKMGDDMDFVEWASTVEMLRNLDERLAFLQRQIT